MRRMAAGFAVVILSALVWPESGSWLFGADAPSGPASVSFTDAFESDRLDPSWTAHAGKGCTIQPQTTGLEIRATERSFTRIQRSLNADSIRVSCTIRPVETPASTAVFLCWDQQNHCQIGVHRDRLRVCEVLGTYTYDYDLGPWPLGASRRVAIELAVDCVRYLAGEPGGELQLVRVSRRPERLAGVPATLAIGRGVETRIFPHPDPFIDPPAPEVVGVSQVRDLQVMPVESGRAHASAEERAAWEAEERDILGEQEMASPGDPAFESVSRHFPAFRWPREAIGVKDHPLAIGVAHDGALQFTEDSARYLHSRGFFEIGDPPYRFASGATPCRRSLLNGWMPVVTLSDRHDGLELEQTAFGYSEGFLPEEPLVAYVRFQVTNLADTPREVPLRWRVHPDSANVPVLNWRLVIPARASRAVDLRVPYAITKSPTTVAPEGEFDRKRAEVVAYWEKLLAPGSRFAIPEERVQNAYRAWLAYNFLNVHKRGDVYHVCDGSGFYTRVYGYSAALYCHGLDLLGYHDLAVRYLDSLLTFMREDGLLHVHFGDTDTGAALWAMSEHYRLTRDADWLRRVVPKMLKMCEWIIRERQKALSQAATQPAVARGLIRYKPYADLLHPAADYFSNSYLCKGLAATADVFDEIGLTGEAARLRKESEEYRKDIITSMDAAIFSDRGMEILPAIPDTRELWKESNGSANGYYGIIAPCMLEAGIPAAKDRKADLLIDALRQRGGLVLGVSRFHDLIDHAYAYGYWMACLERDEVKPAILGLYGSMAYGMTRDTYSAVECTAIRTGENYWTLPHTYSNTQQLRLLRNMLLREDGQDLLIGQAIPRPWLAAGKRVAVSDAPTLFGLMTYRIDAREDVVEVDVLPPTRQTPRAIKVRLRRPGSPAIREIRAQPEVDLSYQGEDIELRNLKSRVKLEVRY
ncbi:MAG TPA: hypothetical protein PKG54_00525 [Phycisphaerae bacterium]|jgi:hypothetical protein|nr:hypothetical protein [Phycisphaerae bacterium]HOB72984.1 hypothetical protein [Phycisphaerae bacterium]HOJ52967.1 hypothetical protein [Phycisphaerae bacterium]HOL24704.1 hypothetical protein [Phycisphaerae bacterium]HPP19240.1 hypothetical protein [Phycisphaerae bacterium]